MNDTRALPEGKLLTVLARALVGSQQGLQAVSVHELQAGQIDDHAQVIVGVGAVKLTLQQS